MSKKIETYLKNKLHDLSFKNSTDAESFIEKLQIENDKLKKIEKR